MTKKQWFSWVTVSFYSFWVTKKGPPPPFLRPFPVLMEQKSDCFGASSWMVTQNRS